MRSRAGLHYMLDKQHRPVECSVREWSEFFEDEARRRVAETETALYWISTVFLGIDHSHSDRGPPILFETMTFLLHEKITDAGVVLDVDWEGDDCQRYANWDDAVTGHNAMVSMILHREAISDVSAIFEKVRANQSLKGTIIKRVLEHTTVGGGDD